MLLRGEPIHEMQRMRLGGAVEHRGMREMCKPLSASRCAA